MSEEKTVIEKLYEDPKSKGFINHLITSYLPIYKSEKVWSFEDKSSHKCNVCHHDLIDSETVLNRMYSSEEYKKEFVDQMRKDIDGEETLRED